MILWCLFSSVLAAWGPSAFGRHPRCEPRGFGFTFGRGLLLFLSMHLPGRAMPCGLALPWSLCCLLSSLSWCRCCPLPPGSWVCYFCFFVRPQPSGGVRVSICQSSLFLFTKVLKCIDIYEYFCPSIVRFVNTYRPICQYKRGTSSRGSGRASASQPGKRGGVEPCGGFGRFCYTPAHAWLGGTPRDPRAPGAARRQKRAGGSPSLLLILSLFALTPARFCLRPPRPRARPRTSSF